MYVEQLSVDLRNVHVEAFEAAWRYVAENHVEIEEAIRANEEA